MAAVTVNDQINTVIGSQRMQIWDVTGTTGDTLDTGMQEVQFVGVMPQTGGITNVAISGLPGAVTLTLTGAIANAKIQVIGI